MSCDAEVSAKVHALNASPGSDRGSKIKPLKTNKRKPESEHRRFISLL
jgi:hypothetical protein